MAFEYIPGDTFLHRLDPRAKLAFVATVMILAVGFTDPIWLAAVLLALFMLIRYAKLPWDKVKGFIKGIAPLAALYTIFNIIMPPVKIPEPTILFRFIIPVSLESLVWATGAVIRFLIILTVLRIMLMLTPIRDLVLALVKLGLPAEFGIALSTGFGYLPVLLDENRKIKEAQMSRAFEYEYRNPIKRFKALFTQLLIPSISNSIRRTQDIALAMESKGFSYNPRARTYMHEIRFKTPDYIFLAITVVVLIFGILAGWVYEWADFINLTLPLLKKLITSSAS